jgi:Lipopolysaccharide-assembly
MLGRNAIRLARLGLCLLVGGCGAYSFSSSLLPSHIKTIGIPLMENRTDRRDLATALADSLTEAFIHDNTLKVVDERDADAVVEGTILEYNRAPFTYDANENVQTYRVEIVLEARFVDVRKNSVLWEEKHLSQWDTYNFVAVGGQPAETEETAIGRVLAKIRDDILNRSIQGW